MKEIDEILEKLRDGEGIKATYDGTEGYFCKDGISPKGYTYFCSDKINGFDWFVEKNGTKYGKHSYAFDGKTLRYAIEDKRLIIVGKIPAKLTPGILLSILYLGGN